MRVLGIDPGLATTGIGLIEGTRNDVDHADWLTITTKAGLPLSDRIGELYRDLKSFIEEHKPDLAVVEKLFFATNQKTAIDVAQARGAILLAVTQAEIPLMEPTPLELKSSICGDGQADKIQVQSMVMRTLNLSEPPRPDDAADALALALFGLYLKQPALV